jgi:hypothetical protein
MAQQIRFRLDGTLYGGIANPMDFGVTIAEEPTLQYRFVSFDNDIKFIGDAYAYINNLIESDCGCDLVSVDVEYLCGQTSWQRLCTGFLILAECVTNYDKCEITTKLFDNTFATLINNNKAIPFSLRSELTKNLETVVPPSYFSVNLFVPATGVYIIDPADLLYGIRVEDAFTHLVACMTDNRVDVSAPAFASGTFENLMVMNGRQIKTNLPVETVMSFEQLFVALNRKLNISLGSTLQANGRPLLTIDFASNLNNQASTIDLISLSGVTRKQDTARIYSTVNFGNQDFYEQWQCNNGDNACTFAQTPFKGFRDEIFGLLGNCNKNVELDLLVQDVIFDTNIIEDVYVWGNQSFDDNPFLINCGNVLATVRFALQGDPYAIGQTVYNADFTNEETAQYWIGGIPNSLQIYIQGFDSNDTGAIVKFDGSFPETDANEFTVFQSAYTGLFQLSGHGVYYLDDFADPNNLFTVFIYQVPYTGVYTFDAGIVLDEFRLTAAPNNPVGTPFGRDRIISIVRLNVNDEEIDTISFAQSDLGNILAFSEITNAQFVCEQGDKIFVNIEVKKATGDDTLFLQRLLQSGTVLGVTEESYFSAIGSPFEPGELQPYDPCDYKNYLYSFEAPLSMDSIQAIMNNPSAPIKFSRTPTINNGINGLCNQVSIDSIIRQNATFTLRSSQKL